MHDIRIADLDGSLPLDADEVTGWAAAVLDAESPGEATLSITFLGADEMRRLNHRSLGHDRVTDVIAFRLEDPSGLAGDVYVCPSEALTPGTDSVGGPRRPPRSGSRTPR
jgi:ssRNA-specific RNase YbeY (16S rRNA maturation enzyme)